MNLQKIESFVEVAEQLNFTAAAERLFTSQATISKQVKALETELGVELINRSHRQIALTTAGQTVLPFAKQLLNTQQELYTALAVQQLQEGMILTIRAIPSIIQYKEFKLLGEFQSLHPNITINFSEAETNQLLPLLESGKADIIFFRLLNEQLPKSSDTLITEADSLSVFMPKNHPLANANSLSVKDINETPLIMLNTASPLDSSIMKEFKHHDLTPNIIYTGHRLDLILKMVAQNMGITILMNKMVSLTDYPELTSVNFSPVISSKLALIRKKHHRLPACDLFWTFAKERIQS